MVLLNSSGNYNYSGETPNDIFLKNLNQAIMATKFAPPVKPVKLFKPVRPSRKSR